MKHRDTRVEGILDVLQEQEVGGLVKVQEIQAKANGPSAADDGGDLVVALD